MSDRINLDIPNRQRYRLQLKVDFDRRSNSSGSISFGFSTHNEFETLIRQAIKVVLGENGSAKDVEVGDYDCHRRIGSIFVDKEDFRLIWAALSVYGSHFGTYVAIRLQKAFELNPSDSN